MQEAGRSPAHRFCCTGRTLGEYRLDLPNAVVLEVKSKERDDSVFISRVLTYIFQRTAARD